MYSSIGSTWNSTHSNKKLVKDGKFSELNWFHEDGQSRSQLWDHRSSLTVKYQFINCIIDKMLKSSTVT